jgi:predicted transcriptional regulator
MKISEVMKKPVVISKDINLYDAAKIMTKNNIKTLIYIEKDKILGLITLQDLAKYFGQNVMFSTAMTKKVITIKKMENVQNAIDIMRKNNINVLPVVDSANKLIGIIQSNDILNEACENEEFLVE